MRCQHLNNLPVAGWQRKPSAQVESSSHAWYSIFQAEAGMMCLIVVIDTQSQLFFRTAHRPDWWAFFLKKKKKKSERQHVGKAKAGAGRWEMEGM